MAACKKQLIIIFISMYMDAVLVHFCIKYTFVLYSEIKDHCEWFHIQMRAICKERTRLMCIYSFVTEYYTTIAILYIANMTLQLILHYVSVTHKDTA